MPRTSVTAADVLSLAGGDRHTMLEGLLRIAQAARPPSAPVAALAKEDLKWVSKLQQDAQEAKRLQRELAARDQEISRLHRRNEELEAFKNHAVQEAAEQAVSQPQPNVDEAALDSPTESQEEDATWCDPAKASSSSDPPSAAAPEPMAAVQRSSELGPVEQQDFAHSLLRGESFRSSLAYQLWRLASAAYRKKSHEEAGEVVSFEGALWEVIAEDSRFNVRVVGRRKRNCGSVEVAFRGTVSEDGSGERTSANWATNLDAGAVPLSVPDLKQVQVHKGFQEAYEAVHARLLAWLEANDARNQELVLAGHSLGGALSMLAAVRLTHLGWPVSAVVTFGSPRVGHEGFRELYQRMKLHACTARFANQRDPVPCVPREADGFEHVVDGCLLGQSSWRPVVAAHSMHGNPESYRSTLAVAIEGRAKQAGPVGALLTWAGADSNSPAELATDILLVRRDLAILAEGMVQALTAVKEAIRDGVEWQWSTDIGSWCERALLYPDKFEPYRGHLPQWFHEIHTHLVRAYEAAAKELKQEERAQQAQHFIVLFMRLSALFIRILRISGCPESVQQQELQNIRKSARALLESCKWWHFDEVHIADIFKWAPFSETAMLELQGPTLQDALAWNCSRIDLEVIARHGHHITAAARAEQSQMLWDQSLQSSQASERSLDELLRLLPNFLVSLHMDFSCNENFKDESLQALAQKLPESLTSLHLDFRFNKNFKDESLQTLAQKLPVGLMSLHLNFYSNENLTDESLQALAQKLPGSLTSLHLDFFRNENFKDESLQALAQKLPESLSSLHLDFRFNTNFKDESLQALAQKLPVGLMSLHLDFKWNKNFKDESLQALAQKLPESLMSLHLNFYSNENFKDESLQALAQKLPEGLTSLHLDFGCNDSFKDESLQALGQKLPVSLTSLHLDVGCNRYFKDESLQALAQKLPVSLTSLHLDFKWNKNFRDASLQALAQKLPESLMSLHLNFYSNEDFKDESLQALAQKLPEGLTSLHLDFGCNGNFKDESLQTLAQKLPAGLASLHLNFHLNENSTDESMQALAQKLPESLTSLHLDFHWNENFKDESLQALAQKLPEGLTSLHLDFGCNRNFKDESLQALGQKLPESLTLLHLDFKWNKNFKDESLQALAQKLPERLMSLYLNFCGQNFKDESLQALAQKLPEGLTSLHLDFGCNDNFKDESLQALGQKLPVSLTSLHLDFKWNKNFRDASLQALAQKLPESLMSLHLNFYSNENFKDESLQALAQKLPEGLTSLHLDFGCNRNFKDESLQALGQKLPESLMSLHLNFYSNENFKDESLQALAQKLPESLMLLHLNFHLNENSTDESLQALAQKLPVGLMSLHLDFGYNGRNFNIARMREALFARLSGCCSLWVNGQTCR